MPARWHLVLHGRALGVCVACWSSLFSVENRPRGYPFEIDVANWLCLLVSEWLNWQPSPLVTVGAVLCSWCRVPWDWLVDKVIVRNEEKKFFKESRIKHLLLQLNFKKTQRGMTRKLKMTSGLLQDNLLNVITSYQESNCTCRRDVTRGCSFKYTKMCNFEPRVFAMKCDHVVQ